MSSQLILHVDMDAFYASIEMRDNPMLVGKPLIIGVLPNERGVVSTCNYEARKYGVHSGMNIKEAHRLCPNGIFMRTNIDKYREVSEELHKIWEEYCTVYEPVAFDEAYLDITETSGNSMIKAREIANIIKERTFNEIGLTCSIGIAYSKNAAKMASEEKKPNGYYEILTPKEFHSLIIDREIQVVSSIGNKTAEKLNNIGIYTVRDIEENRDKVIELLGNHGKLILTIISGEDNRKVIPYNPADAKSISREITLQKDTDDIGLIDDAMLLISIAIYNKAKHFGLVGGGITVKITYNDMKSITRSKLVNNDDFDFNINSAYDIYSNAISIFNDIDIPQDKKIRLIGIGMYNLMKESETQVRQLSFFDEVKIDTEDKLNNHLKILGIRYNLDFINNLYRFKQSGVLHKTIEYMRKYRIKNGYNSINR